MSLAAVSRALADVNILVAAETLMDCQLIKDVLESQRQRLRVVASAVSRAEVASTIGPDIVDVALISESLQDGRVIGLEVVKDLSRLSPRTRPIVLLNHDSQESVVNALRAGARGVFSRADSLSLLPKCIRVVSAGQIWISNRHLEWLLEAFGSSAAMNVTTATATGQQLLTKREADVVKLVVTGLSSREVAEKLGLSEHTVSNYLFRVYEKLGISSRVELVLHALKAEL